MWQENKFKFGKQSEKELHVISAGRCEQSSYRIPYDMPIIAIESPHEPAFLSRHHNILPFFIIARSGLSRFITMHREQHGRLAKIVIGSSGGRAVGLRWARYTRGIPDVHSTEMVSPNDLPRVQVQGKDGLGVVSRPNTRVRNIRDRFVRFSNLAGLYVWWNGVEVPGRDEHQVPFHVNSWAATPQCGSRIQVRFPTVVREHFGPPLDTPGFDVDFHHASLERRSNRGAFSSRRHANIICTAGK